MQLKIYLLTYLLSYAKTLPSGKAFLNNVRITGPAIINCNGNAIMKFIGIFLISLLSFFNLSDNV